MGLGHIPRIALDGRKDGGTLRSYSTQLVYVFSKHRESGNGGRMEGNALGNGKSSLSGYMGVKGL